MGSLITSIEKRPIRASKMVIGVPDEVAVGTGKGCYPLHESVANSRQVIEFAAYAGASHKWRHPLPYGSIGLTREQRAGGHGGARELLYVSLAVAFLRQKISGIVNTSHALSNLASCEVSHHKFTKGPAMAPVALLSGRAARRAKALFPGLCDSGGCLPGVSEGDAEQCGSHHQGVDPSANLADTIELPLRVHKAVP